jgi:DNA polymerase III subunit delta'
MESSTSESAMPSDAHHSHLWPRVIGQGRVKGLLLSAVHTGRLAHAYLFYGPKGVGKDAMALELARMLHCARQGDNACGECESCTRMNALQNPDVRLITALPVGKGEDRDDGPLDKLTAGDLDDIREQYARKGADPYCAVSIARASSIKINSIRDIRREVPLSTIDHRRRVYVVSNAEDMGTEAANMLLKTLEEPPAQTMFILTTSKREALPQTIISRCQQVRFDPIAEPEICAALVERKGVDDVQARLVARLSGGSYSWALDLLEKDLMQERIDVVNFISNTMGGRHIEVGEIIERVTAERDRDRVVRFLHLMLIWMRDAMVLVRGGTIINIDQEDRLKKFVDVYPRADLGVAMGDIEHSISLVERNVYITLVLYALAGRLKITIH